MAKAKVTSKGQITIPAEIRAVLGVKTGDVLVFETKAEYVTVVRERSAIQVLDELEPLLRGHESTFASDREALEERFAAMDMGEFYGDGTIGIIKIEPRHDGDSVAARLADRRSGRQGGGDAR